MEEPRIRSGSGKIESADPIQDSSLEDICRICHGDGETDSPLITPCYCSGSLRYVHDWCLQEWIKSSQTKCCEICKFHFIMHSKMKPFRKWKKLEDIPEYKQPKVLRSILIHVGVITWLVVAIYVQFVPFKTENDWPLWLWVFAIITTFIGELIYLFIHCQLFRRWWNFNRIIYVENAPEKGSMVHQHQRKVAVFSVVAKLTASIPTGDHTKLLLSDEEEFQCYQSGSNNNANDIKKTFTKIPTNETVSFKTTLTTVTDNAILPVVNQTSSFSELVILSTASDP